MTLSLKGNLTSDIGAKSRIKLTVSLNGTVGLSAQARASRYVVQRRHSLLVAEER